MNASSGPRGGSAGGTAVSRPSDSPDDASLILLMSQGDEQALGKLYDRWSPTVHALATHMLRDATEAEEIVEETFWQAWRQASRYEAVRGSASTWLITIARSRALDRIRALRRSREDPDVDGTIFDTIATDSLDPSAVAEAGDRRAQIVRALGELPKEQREALEFAYFGGLSQTEISDRTGIPLGTVKTRMRLALQKLRDRLTILSEVTS
ncbi:MAG: sigma-70 family RNA polymerase sigma factor [Gemmatimonadaceae bacterium]